MNRRSIDLDAKTADVIAGFDVVVVGGGTAGVAAAIAAARGGADTCIVEKSFTVGGLATAGNVVIFLPLCDGRGRQVIGGLTEELILLAEAGIGSVSPARRISAIPESWRDPESRERFQLGYNPAVFALQLEELLIREGVRLLYDARFSNVVMEDGTITHIVAETSSGTAAVACGAVVDATGDAAVCAVSGEETVSLDTNVRAGWFYYLQDGTLQLRCMSDPFTPDGTPSPSVPRGYSGCDPFDVTRMVIDSNRLIEEELGRIRAEHPEADVELVRPPSIPSFRMTRRLAGTTVISEAGRENGAEDTVAWCGDWRAPGPVYPVQYGILHGPRVRNLLTAGRCVSAEGRAWDVFRVIPVCTLTGEIAGTACALSRGSGDLRFLDCGKLRAALEKAGNITSL